MRSLASWFHGGNPRRRVVSLLFAVVPPVWLFACGSRTPLPFDDTFSVEIAVEAGVSVDARRDAPRDVQLPTIDAAVRDARRDDCPDADSTLVYLVTEDTQLLAFDPAAASFRRIGFLACPESNSALRPFSMAVDRAGVAYVLYADWGAAGPKIPGDLFQVSTKTGACAATPFVPGQLGYNAFGMGFASDNGGPEETLYIADNGDLGLASINVDTFTVNRIGQFNPQIGSPELTGTGDGRLFAFYADGPAAPSFIGEIDKSNANVIAENRLAQIGRGNSWAFAFWGGDFYTFTELGAGSAVTRYRPGDGSVSRVATYSAHIVGAGVSTCAPQR